jgi:hypothetical protein
MNVSSGLACYPAALAAAVAFAVSGHPRAPQRW